MRILAIDDALEDLASLASLLKTHLPECELVTAHGGREGIEKAAALQPDAILLDVRMPVLDGFETCRALKGNPATRHVPVVFLTGMGDDSGSRTQGLEAGGDAFLVKPVEPHELTAQVRAMVRIKKAEDRLRQESQLLEGLVAERTAELSRRIRHANALERIARSSLEGSELEEVLSAVLEEVRSAFDADRAALVFPCDPDVPTVSVLAERTRPEWPGVFARGGTLEVTPDVAEGIRRCLASEVPSQSGTFAGAAQPIPPAVAGPYSIRSEIEVAVRPRTGPPWLLTIQHCAEPRCHDRDDLLLVKAVADRLSEILTSLIAIRGLRESDERFRTLAEFAPVGIYLADARGDCTFSNRAWTEMTGLGPAEAAGSGWARTLHPDDRGRILDSWKDTTRGNDRWHAEYRVVDLSGKVTWVEGSAHPLVDRNGARTGYIGTMVDVTERKRIEETQAFLLRCGADGRDRGFFDSLARFLAESLGMDFVCIDRLEGDGLHASTVAVFCDGAFQDNVTYALKDTPCGDVVGKTVCCFPASVCQFFPRDEVLQELRAESYVGVTLFGHDGRPIGLIAVIGRRPLVNREAAEATLGLVAMRAAAELERRDAEDAIRESEVRYRRLSEELELRVLERTAALATSNRELEAFSYSVSHDLRAPLRAVDGFSALVVEKYADSVDPEARRLLGIVRANAQKMSRLIDDLLAFSRTGRSEMSLGRLDMAAMARTAFADVTPDPEVRARIDFRLGSLPALEGDAALLQQVWVNLLSNAVKFSGHSPAPIVEVSGEVNGSMAVYRVRDNGAGFDMAYAGKLFGVFQRLHGVNEFEGTGVGLALVQRIVGRHGGKVWAEGAVGQGATISFTLPLRGQEEGAPGVAAVLASTAGR